MGTYRYLVDTSFVDDATPAQRQAISQWVPRDFQSERKTNIGLIFRGRFSRGVRTKFVPVPSELNVNGEDLKVVGAALVSGLYPKLLTLDASGGMKTITNQQPVAIVRCFCTYMDCKDLTAITASKFCQLQSS